MGQGGPKVIPVKTISVVEDDDRAFLGLDQVPREEKLYPIYYLHQSLFGGWERR